MDNIILGDKASERSHNFSDSASEVITGGLRQTARRLQPLSPVSWNGGSVTFTLKVDPNAQNYVTVKLWGSDCGEEEGRLVLYLDGKQVGYRHEGEYDVLNQTDAEALDPGHFVYQTVALPTAMTKGKTEVTLKIAGLGSMWPYGKTFDLLQHRLERPTRGIYRVYTHTSERFEPDASEVQGAPSNPAPRPRAVGEDLLAQTRATVIQRVRKLMQVSPEASAAAQGPMLVLAQAYNTRWTGAFHSDETIAAIVRYGDAYVRGADLNPETWGGAGNFGEAIARVSASPAFQQVMDEQIEVEVPLDPSPDVIFRRMKNDNVAIQKAKMSRRDAWARVLRLSVDGHRLHGRRYYTNQSQIVDYGIYASNRGLEVLNPAQALPERAALRYLYESIGLRPWLGNDMPGGSHEAPYGQHYYLITDKGLSRELGWVGTYGETILRFMHDMADLSRDEAIKQQLVKVQKARFYFRYPSEDPDGYRQMKLTGQIDSRTAHFPVSHGDYTSADVDELFGMEVPALTKDPEILGAAQQSLEDGQYLLTLASRVNDKDTLKLMRNVDAYATVDGSPQSPYRLPMTDGQPDFVFADEQDGVVALKHGDDRVFVNFYYRQEHAPSGSTRILETTPQTMRIATVKSHFEVIPSGVTWTRPNIIDFERTGGSPPPGEHIDQAWAGETLQISKRPDDSLQPAYGDWGPFVGKAAFYWLRYGDYLIGLNTSDGTTYTLPTPVGSTQATDLVSGKIMNLPSGVKVGARSTVVLYLGH